MGAGPARAPGLPGGPRTLEARRWVSYLSIAVYIFRKCRSLRRFEKRGIPAQTHPNRGWGGSLLPPSSRPKRSSQKGITLDCLHPQLPGPRSAPLRFRNTVHPPPGKSYPPWCGLSLPRVGNEGWDGVQTKAGFQLAGELALPYPRPSLVLLAFPADSQVVFLPKSGVCLLLRRRRGGLQNDNHKTHLSFPFSSL